MHKFILIILAIRDYFTRFFGYHYPNEIVQLIILASHKSFKIHCGYNYTSLISDKTYIWGNSTNESRPGAIYENYPKEFPIQSTKIKCGYKHIAALTPQSELYVIGSNSYGQIGLHNILYQCEPYKLLVCDIKKIYCGQYHTIVIIKSRSEIYVWGANEYGQLGLGNILNYYSPQKLQLSNVSSISCGVSHTIAFVKNSNKIYVWGTNYCGELGLGDNRSHNKPTELFLSFDVLKIKCGQCFTIVLSTNNKLFACGINEQGQLGLGDRARRNTLQELLLKEIQIISISCGIYHTMALTNRGEIYGWGNNGDGQLGLGYASQVAVLIPTKISLDKIFLSISCGSFHTIAVTIYNDLYVWGHNKMGQLGLADYTDRNAPSLLEFKF